MFSSSQNIEEDQLYNFNTNLSAPSSSAFGARGPSTAFQPLGTSAGRAPMTSMARNAPGSRAGGLQSRAGLMTGQAGGGGGEARPMTSVSGAGYKGNIKENKAFDPLNIGNRGPAPPLAEKSDNSPEDKAKEMEKKVHRLIEASADAVLAKDMLRALEKAKEAGKAERSLCKFREGNNLSEQINLDLTYAICFNLANAYYHNKMYEESLNTYSLIVKNKQYTHSGRLRVNMGNIYYEQKKYPQAIKMYRMALDQIPSTGKELKYRIFRNIGNSFVKLGQFQDAIESYENIMINSADIQTAFNLLLCYYARGDKEKLKKHFIKMLSIPIVGMTESDEENNNNNNLENNDNDIINNINEKEDNLKDELFKKVEKSNECILSSARLIAPIIDETNNYELGYKWIIEQLRSDYEAVLSKFEIDFSMMYMKKRRFEDAIIILKNFERKDEYLRAIASTNLSFIYYLEGDYVQANKHADIAFKYDRYNAKALVNKGNCLMLTNDYENAREKYLEAVGVEADCIEAIYNLGLVNIKLNNLNEAQSAFDKLYTSLSSMPEALYQLGCIYERYGTVENLENAAKTFQLLLNKVPGDPHLCCKLGQIYEKLQDDNTACHWHTEAHRYYPVNLNITSWLGVWYVKREMYEQAIEYFQRATVIQPSEIKWSLMVTSCYRRLGDYNKALELYQKIHEEHPDNMEALSYLESMCRDMGRSHEEYSRKLEKLRRSQPASAATGNTQQQTGAGMNTRANTTSAAPPQRTERSNRPERTERPTASTATSGGTGGRGDAATRAMEEFTTDPSSSTAAAGRSPMAAPKAGGSSSSTGRAPVRSARPADEDDDFGDTDVTSLLV